MLAERWGLPPEMALIAGRHHDPCEGMELDVLRIVHVACCLADVLGYDVVKPLVPSSVGDVLAQLPARARARLSRDPKEFCERIEQRIREFGSEGAKVPPEEALALLASASAAENPEQSSIIATEPEPDASKNQSRGNREIILWIAAVLAALAAMALWVLR